MFDLSPEKLLVIALIAVIVLGPERLPKAARTFAKVLHQVRTTTGSLQAEMAEALAEPRAAINEAVGDLGIPTDLRVPKMPKVPTTKSLARQVFAPPSPTRARAVEASSVVASSGIDSVRDVLPDDPSLN